ncbi:GGDEF domain-containing protein [Sphingomonas sp. TF3]|uniref:GGDEF domain-containing protein n=1 Tax=Sphingomonas sp. TF3 TaxID=2495580 RepID=UPI000F85C727|nr:GGDEF domain-containing protein [Sphingomonas sp. TF3]RUN78470.1 GGDEF domain-containing protein [Sphingomonas sp. TF3]
MTTQAERNAVATGTLRTRPAPQCAPPSRPKILSRLLRGWSSEVPVAADAQPSHKRKLYDEIGHFLFAHNLDLTPLNFGCAHDYVVGGDRRLVKDVDTALDQQSVSNGWIEDYVAGRQRHSLAPEMLVTMAAQAEGELNRCLVIMKASADRANDYSESLSAPQPAVTAEDMIERLAGLTREMIGQTRLAEAEMRASYSKVSQLQTSLRAARKASETDPLTGLPNRRGLERRFGELCATHAQRPMAIALCDVDHFKAVNDRFGHETGDRVLKTIAGELRSVKNRGGYVVRLGGEEFAVLLPDHALERAGAEVDRVRERLGARNLIDSVTERPIGSITFSAGIAMVDGQQGLRRALRLADAALYAAKHAGRNRIYAAFGDGQMAPMHNDMR